MSTSSAIRPDSPQARGVALPWISADPDLCVQVYADGDSGGVVEQNEKVVWERPSNGMRRDEHVEPLRPLSQCWVWHMARCAEKNVRATRWMSTHPVAYTGTAISCIRNRRKKYPSLAHFSPLMSSPEFTVSVAVSSYMFVRFANSGVFASVLLATRCCSTSCVTMSTSNLLKFQRKLLSNFDLVTPVFLGSIGLIHPFVLLFEPWRWKYFPFLVHFEHYITPVLFS